MQASAPTETQSIALHVKVHIEDQDKCFNVYPKKRFHDLFADRMVMMRPFA